MPTTMRAAGRASVRRAAVRVAAIRGIVVRGVGLVGLIAVAAAGCGSGQPASSPPSLGAAPADYLAIAKPANHRLDVATSAYAKDIRHNLAAARRDLLAEAATELWFDQHLAKISLPAQIEATAQAMIRANNRRIALTKLQARSETLAAMASFTARHAAADTAVEAQSRIIRRQLGLPPPPVT